MSGIFSDEFIKKIRNIPSDILRKLTPGFKSRKKIELAQFLFSQDPKKLQDLATYYTITKELSIYLLKIDVDIDPLKIKESLIQSKGHTTKSTTEDFIVYCNEVFLEPTSDAVYVSLKIHSPIKKYHGEDPTTFAKKEIELRNGFNVHVIIHPKDKIVECRTSRLLRCTYAAKALGLLIFNNQNVLDKVVISSEKQSLIDKEIRHKLASITELNFAGTNEIILKGEDVEHTIKVLLESHGLDFQKHEGKISLHKSELANTPVKFFPDGKITVKKTVEDPYELIRKLL
jgi:hypothetical protein